jgi:hypothetical protein
MCGLAEDHRASSTNQSWELGVREPLDEDDSQSLIYYITKNDAGREVQDLWNAWKLAQRVGN